MNWLLVSTFEVSSLSKTPVGLIRSQLNGGLRDKERLQSYYIPIQITVKLLFFIWNLIKLTSSARNGGQQSPQQILSQNL